MPSTTATTTTTRSMAATTTAPDAGGPPPCAVAAAPVASTAASAAGLRLQQQQYSPQPHLHPTNPHPLASPSISHPHPGVAASATSPPFFPQTGLVLPTSPPPTLRSSSLKRRPTAAAAATPAVINPNFLTPLPPLPPAAPTPSPRPDEPAPTGFAVPAPLHPPASSSDSADEEEFAKYQLDGRLHHTPLHALFAAGGDGGIAVLDVGSGRGGWARCMARAYPRITVVSIKDPGADESAGEDLPSNLRRVNADVMQRLPSFTSHTTATRPAVLAELRRVVRPGGFVQLVEPHWRVRGIGPLALDVYRKASHAHAAAGLDPESALTLDTALLDAGFVDVVEGFHALPIAWSPAGDREWRFYAAAVAAGLSRFPAATAPPQTTTTTRTTTAKETATAPTTAERTAQILGSVRREMAENRSRVVVFFACGMKAKEVD
ncbi:hypothetical protein DFJ73DRAFT_800601 [Zopfochytrium polystomum]|nr:hypothetical protein DFJ73DRAFT_800601 [Zopfochytrium polystomum]